MYDLLSIRKTGVNWVKCLPDYARTLNDELKEELSWKSAFEVYYGRKLLRKMRSTQHKNGTLTKKRTSD